MKKKKNLEEEKGTVKPLLHPDHPMPVTRREFLATGLMGLSALAFTSGASALLSPSNAFGALNCGGPNILCGRVPFLCIDGVGGMNFAGGNVLVGFGSNQEQEEFANNTPSDYRMLGIPDSYHPSRSGMINTTFGLKFHTTSGILQGLQEVLSPRPGETKDLREYVDGLLLCAITADDTQTNPINTSYVAQKAGAIGDLVQLVGSNNSVSGGNSYAPNDEVNLMIKPSALTVNSGKPAIEGFDTSESLLSLGSNLMSSRLLDSNGAGAGQRMKGFMRMLAGGSSGLVNRLKLDAKSQADIEAYVARMGSSADVFGRFNPAQLNPRSNATDAAAIMAVYNVPNLSSLTHEQVLTANMVNLLTNRVAGAGTLEIGGCDYHNRTAISGQLKDIEIGRHLGHAIRLANARGVPMFFHLFTDGAPVADYTGQTDPALPNRVVWSSDDGTRSSAMMFVFNPNKRRVVVGNNEHSNFLLAGKTRQIGYYKAGGGNVIDAHSLSNNSSKLWIAVILNYLATQVNSTDDDQIIYEAGEAFKAKFTSQSLPADWRNFIRLKSLVA